jgi:hypothetical protein
MVLLIAVACGVGSLRSYQDFNYDQLHYHYYLGWSFVAGRLDQDIAPAGFGTFFNPLIQALTYLGITHLPPRVFGVLLGMAHGLNGFIVYRIARRILAGVPGMWALAAVTAVVALRGPGAVSLLGTTFGDNLVSIPALAALLLLLDAPGLPSARRVAAAGALAGGAAGLKLTYGLFLVPLGIVVVHAAWQRRSWRLPVVFGAAALAGLVLTGGYWGAQLWMRFRNPVFPFVNGWFRSPYYSPSSFRDEPYLARGWRDVLAMPLDIALGHTKRLQPVSFQDGRYLTLVGIAAAAAMRRLGAKAQRGAWSPAATGLTLYFTSALALWLVAFHYYRYFVAGEFLAPVLILALLRFALPRWLPAAWMALALTITLTSWTNDWGRVPWTDDWYRVRIPDRAVPPHAIVLVGGALLSYTLPSFPPGTRFFGLMGYQTNGLNPQISYELRHHTGPILLLSRDDVRVPTPLALFGLERTQECSQIRTRPHHRFDLCRLIRVW